MHFPKTYTSNTKLLSDSAVQEQLEGRIGRATVREGRIKRNSTLLCVADVFDGIQTIYLHIPIYLHMHIVTCNDHTSVCFAPVLESSQKNNKLFHLLNFVLHLFANGDRKMAYIILFSFSSPQPCEAWFG